VRKLSTNAGDRPTLEKHLLLVAQGAGVTLHAEALRRGTSYGVGPQSGAGGSPAENDDLDNP